MTIHWKSTLLGCFETIAVSGTYSYLRDTTLVDLAVAVGKLKATRIFLSEDIVQGALKRHHERQPKREPDPGIER